MPNRKSGFQIKVVRGRVLNTCKCPSIGKERNDLIKIIVVIFDLESFTRFFDTAGVNKNIVVSSYVNSFLSWVHYRLELEIKSRRLPERPKLSKFLGDGILYVWEVEQQRMKPLRALDLMNFCWNLTAGKDCYEKEFLPQFIRKLGHSWHCEYPKHLRASMALGHAVKYVKQRGSVDYVSECINIASRLTKINPELYFVAHSDVYLGAEAFHHEYEKKKVPNIRGLDGPVVVYVDTDDFDALSDKSMFQDVL